MLNADLNLDFRFEIEPQKRKLHFKNEFPKSEILNQKFSIVLVLSHTRCSL
jgi:hypothetical protein